MKYDEIIAVIGKTYLFDIYMLNIYTGELLGDPERTKQIKEQLRVNTEVQYFHPVKKAIITAVVMDIKRSTVEVSNIENGMRVTVPFMCLKLNGSDLNIPRPTKVEDKSSFMVGERVGFVGKNNIEKHGIIKRLNSKTATIIVEGRERWRVSYSFVFKIVDGFSTSSTNTLHREPKSITLKKVVTLDAPEG